MLAILAVPFVTVSADACTAPTSLRISHDLQNMHPPEGECCARGDRQAGCAAPPPQANQHHGGDVDGEKKKVERDNEEAPWILPLITSVAVALVALFSAITALFVGRSAHGQTVGRLALSPIRVDVAGHRLLVRIRNTGASSLFSVRIEGACRAGGRLSDFQALLLEELAGGADMTRAVPLVAGNRHVSALADGPGGRADVVLRASYTDHGDRSRNEKRDYAGVGNAFRLLRSGTRLRWNSLG